VKTIGQQLEGANVIDGMMRINGASDINLLILQQYSGAISFVGLRFYYSLKLFHNFLVV
jgi:hypothetical protein